MGHLATFTVKNYRCFADTHPLRIDLSTGVTAFLGPNNSGKSTILKFFYEFRQLFTVIGSNLGELLASKGYDIPTSGTTDGLELFCDLNVRQIQIDIDLAIEGNTGPADIIGATFLADRPPHGITHKLQWHGSIRARDPAIQLTLPNLAWTYPQLQDRQHTYNAKALSDVGRVISAMIFVGPFRNALAEGGGRHYDLDVGATFVQQWGRWKTGLIRRDAQTVERVTEDICRLFRLGRLDINTSPDPPGLHLSVDGRPFKLYELGAGMAEFIVILMTAAIKTPTFILIDEPELHLHPALQLEFMRTLVVMRVARVHHGHALHRLSSIYS